MLFLRRLLTKPSRNGAFSISFGQNFDLFRKRLFRSKDRAFRAIEIVGSMNFAFYRGRGQCTAFSKSLVRLAHCQ